MTGTDERAAALHVDDGRCADLVLGLLEDAQRDAALAHVAACAECGARLRAHAAAAERARADWRARGCAAPVLPMPARRHPALRRAVYGGVAAAAVIAIAFAVPLLRTRPAPHGAERWLPAPGEIVSVREGAGSDPRLARGLAAYARHDLATAERELAAAEVTGRDQQLRDLYLAHAKLARGDARAAVSLLRGLAWNQVPEPWRREAAWLLARALRATGDGAAADTIERALRGRDPAIPFTP